MNVDVTISQVEQDLQDVDSDLAGLIPVGALDLVAVPDLDEEQLLAQELLDFTSGASPQERRKVRVKRGGPSGRELAMGDQLDMAGVMASLPFAGGGAIDPTKALQDAALEASRQLQQDSRSWVAACGGDTEQFMGKLQEVLAPLVTALQATPSTAHIDPSQLRSQLAGGLLQLDVVQQLPMHPSARGPFVQALQQLRGSAII